jgi:hypothetical protein
LIVADPAVDPDHPVPVDQVIAPDPPRTAPAVHAGPCTRPGLSPVELRDPADGLLLAPRGPDLVPALVSARPGPASVVQVA